MIRQMIRKDPQQRMDLTTVICMLRVLQGSEMLLNGLNIQVNGNEVIESDGFKPIEIIDKSTSESNSDQKIESKKKNFLGKMVPSWVKGKSSKEGKPNSSTAEMEHQSVPRPRPLSNIWEDEVVSKPMTIRELPRVEQRPSALSSQLQNPSESEVESVRPETVTLRKTQSLRDSSMKERYLANVASRSSKLERSHSISINQSPKHVQSDGNNSEFELAPIRLKSRFVVVVDLVGTPGEVRRKIEMFASRDTLADGYTSPKDRRGSYYSSPPINSNGQFFEYRTSPSQSSSSHPGDKEE